MSLLVIILLALVAVFVITAILALLGSVELIPLPQGATDALIKLTALELVAVIAVVTAVPFVVQSANRFLSELPESARGSDVGDTIGRIKALAERNGELEKRLDALEGERDKLAIQAERSLENVESFEEVRGDVLLALLQLKRDVDELGTPSISLTYPGEAERKEEVSARIAKVMRALEIPVNADDPASVESALAAYQQDVGFSEEASQGYFGPGTWRALLAAFAESHAAGSEP